MSDANWELLQPEDRDLTPVGEIYRSQFINAVNSRQQWQNMGEAALAAAWRMKRGGENKFEVNIKVEGGLDTQGIAYNAYQNYLRAANACALHRKPVAQLTGEEKFAICVAARVPIRSTTDRGALVMKLETAVRCAIVWDDEVSSYHVYYSER